MIYETSKFFTTKELFIFSRVSSQWHKNLLIRKKRILIKMKDVVSGEHYCSNLCPCALESLFDNYMSDFFLKRYVCRMISGKKVPNWLTKLVT
jgi:hypothetical protein